MARNTYAFDFGSYEIKVYDKQKDLIFTEKTALAWKDGENVFAYGEEAYSMLGKVPDSVQIHFPMQQGVISKFHDMQVLLKYLLRKERQFMGGSQYMIAVPTDVTELQKKAFFDLLIHSHVRAKEVHIVERAIADAVGLNLDIINTSGVMILNFGGDTTELSILSQGGVVFNRLIPIGGSTFDYQIIQMIRNSHDFLIGRRTAENLRKDFGVFTSESDASMEVMGRDLILGVPARKQISIQIVRSAMKEPLEKCIKEIHALLERTPPELRKGIEKNGIFLTGGVANIQGLESYIEEMVGIPTRTAIEPSICGISGLKKMTESKDLGVLAFSILNENYRWMK